MSYSKAKKILLGSLIILSIYLSFRIWVPNISEIDNNDIPTENRIPGTLVDRDIHDVYSPRNFVYHVEKSTDHAVEMKSEVFNGVYGDFIDSLLLEDLETGEAIPNNTYFNELVNQSEVMELVYSELIPFGILIDNFNEMPVDLADTQFNRILIDLNDNSLIRFYNTKSEIMTDVEVSDINLDLLSDQVNADNTLYDVYSQRFQDDFTYLPVNPVTLDSRSFLVERLPNNLYTSYFFPDPSGVELRVSNNISRYIDPSTELRINNSTNVLTYFSQMTDLNELTRTERFVTSINELNTLENWTNTIKYVGINEQTKEIYFRRYFNNHPIFSDGELSSVSEVAVFEQGLSHLKLPLRVIQTPITIEEDSDRTIASGIAVVNILSNVIEPDQIQDLAIGFKWVDSEESSQVVEFAPMWFIKESDVWTDVESYVEAEGGSTDEL